MFHVALTSAPRIRVRGQGDRALAGSDIAGAVASQRVERGQVVRAVTLLGIGRLSTKIAAKAFKIGLAVAEGFVTLTRATVRVECGTDCAVALGQQADARARFLVQERFGFWAFAFLFQALTRAVFGMEKLILPDAGLNYVTAAVAGQGVECRLFGRAVTLRRSSRLCTAVWGAEFVRIRSAADNAALALAGASILVKLGHFQVTVGLSDKAAARAAFLHQERIRGGGAISAHVAVSHRADAVADIHGSVEFIEPVQAQVVAKYLID